MFDIGDIVDWLGCPVLVLTKPVLATSGTFKGGWTARVAYLRKPTNPTTIKKPGHVLEEFMLKEKVPWTGELTDAEHAMAMRLLLIGE